NHSLGAGQTDEAQGTGRAVLGDPGAVHRGRRPPVDVERRGLRGTGRPKGRDLVGSGRGGALDHRSCPYLRREHPMKRYCLLVVVVALLPHAQAQDVKSDIPYADKADKLQVLDVYSPKGAKNAPVVFWIHGGGWQTGDKSDVQIKPQAF